MMDLHTYKISSKMWSYVASGGVAGSGDSVVSESQAYSLLMTGIILASWDSQASGTQSETQRQEVIDAFEAYFNGWKKMCQISSAPCQSDKMCQAEDETISICLPDWKFDAQLSSVQGTGSAPDADEDAITGMMLAVKAVENDSTKPTWYDEVRKWADASATSFMKHDTNGEFPGKVLVKLGSCWGGWGADGNNPSYHAPGQYKLFAQYQAEFPSNDRVGYTAADSNEWSMLINTSHEVLRAVQCPSQGIVPNWARVDLDSSNSVVIDAGSFSGSGTPQYEFGAEASRTIYRVAMDLAMYPTADPVTTDAYTFLGPMISTLEQTYSSSGWQNGDFGSCSVTGMCQSITMFGDWVNNGFIYGPMFSSLIGGSPSSQALDVAAAKLAALPVPTSYYPRSWVLLSNLMLNGAVEDSGRLVRGV